jgi:hypothetical protein
MTPSASTTSAGSIGSLPSCEAEQPPPPRLDGVVFEAAAPWPVYAIVQPAPATLD